MTDIQNIEIERYHDKIVKDVRHLIEKYREIMDWDVPDNDPAEADRLIFKAINAALADEEKPKETGR
jgi:hypothetical protein